ncbi:MAG: hypothetical protein WB565_07250 [Acidimicrobiales bacterium]
MTAEPSPTDREQIADWTASSTHGSSGSPHRILPPDHPLAGVFAVGTSATPTAQESAAEVVGVRLGKTVQVRLARPNRGSGPRFEGKVGTVDVLNPADREVHVAIDRASGWFCSSELTPVAVATPTKSARRPPSSPQRVMAGVGRAS